MIHGDRDERVRLDADHVVAVGPEVDRTLTSGPDGARVLCIGGAPGKPYYAARVDHGIGADRGEPRAG